MFDIFEKKMVLLKTSQSSGRGFLLFSFRTWFTPTQSFEGAQNGYR